MDAVPIQPRTPAFLMTLANVGFADPMSVVHDPLEDVYLVANADGGLTAEDGRGFISRVSPMGQVLDLKWVDGDEPGVTLHAPGGMAILDDTLFVADIHCLRRFHRSTGQPLLATCLDPAADPGDVTGTVGDAGSALSVQPMILRGVAISSGGDLFFSEAGSTFDLGAVYLMKRTAEVPQILATADGTLLEGNAVGGPVALCSDEEGLLVSTFGSGELFRVTSRGERIQLLGPSELRLHGVLCLGEEGALVSSWGDSAVYQVSPDGSLSGVVSSVETPAAMGYDMERNRVLVPLVAADELLVLSLLPVPWP